MPRQLKFVEGPVIKTMDEFTAHVANGGYLIHRLTKQRIHPGWAMSWQFRQCFKGVQMGVFRIALPNPEHPAFKKEPT